MSAAAPLGAIELFAPLAPESRLELARDAQEQCFPPAKRSCVRATPAARCYVVLSGRARVRGGAGGQEVAVIEPADSSVRCRC